MYVYDLPVIVLVVLSTPSLSATEKTSPEIEISAFIVSFTKNNHAQETLVPVGPDI